MMRRWTIAALVALGGTAARAEVLDRVLAVVSGDLILLSDVRAARDFGLVTVPPDAPDPTAATLARLIDRSLVLAEVERFAPPEPRAADVDRRLQDVRGMFSSPEALADALARAGIDERHLRQTLRQDLRMEAYLSQRFTMPPPSEEELGRYYREHPELFARDGILRPFEEVRTDVAAAATTDRRRTVVDEWVAGLRRRADIRQLYP
jgi:hypothetical protein